MHVLKISCKKIRTMFIDKLPLQTPTTVFRMQTAQTNKKIVYENKIKKRMQKINKK